MPYTVNEMFCSVQGEGARAGSLNVFVRFAGCNLKCVKDVEGFDCDTDFTSVYKRYATAEELVSEVDEVWGLRENRSVILTGGEPALQVDEELVAAFKRKYFYLAIETNGTIPVAEGIDWISCSPKTAEHTLKLFSVNELRYVRGTRQGVPRPKIKADHYYLSPAAESGGINQENLAWCQTLIEQNPHWKLSVQMHKLWRKR